MAPTEKALQDFHQLSLISGKNLSDLETKKKEEEMMAAAMAQHEMKERF